jgi:hypothetical protein
MLSPRHFLGVALLGAVVGCNRFEYVRDECPPPQSPGPRSAIGWLNVPRREGSLEVRVLDLASEQALRNASVRIRRDSAAPFVDVPADSDRYRLIGIEPGQYLLDVRYLGYRRAQAPISVRADSGVRAVAVMARERLTLDGCGYVVSLAKKPWWKRW